MSKIQIIHSNEQEIEMVPFICFCSNAGVLILMYKIFCKKKTHTPITMYFEQNGNLQMGEWQQAKAI